MANDNKRINNEQILQAYKETGSVWAAGKKIGMAGQTVHERLKTLGYKFPGRNWTNEEVAELKELIENNFPLSRIAHKLGRPYNGVALKASRLGLKSDISKRNVKIKRGQGYDKESIKKHLKAVETSNLKVTTYGKQNSLEIEQFVQAIEKHFPEWWEKHKNEQSNLSEIQCPQCKRMFKPFTKKQIYCTRKCGSDYRTDQSYFGGKRSNTIGLSEKVCQLCGRIDIKGLSSHHVLGKENDPENDYLVALCPGCHHIVTILGGRTFTGEPEIWEALIQLVMMRKRGSEGSIYAYVDIEIYDNDSESEQMFD